MHALDLDQVILMVANVPWQKEGSRTITPAQEAEAVNCAICIDVLKSGQMVKALNCSHKFHSKCINDWLKVKLKCPLCKSSVI